MRRRSRLAVTFVALLTVGWSVVTTQPSGSALAADPEAELAETRAQLADAQSTQQSLAAALERQRTELAQLAAPVGRPRHASSTSRAPSSRRSPPSTSGSAALLAAGPRPGRRDRGTHRRAHGQIADLDTELIAVAADINRRTAELEEREALLEDHLRSAYERSQTSLLEMLLSADSLDEATTQVGYLMSVSDQDARPGRGHPRHPRGARDPPRDAQGRASRPRRGARRRARRGGDAQGTARGADRPEAQLAELQAAADQKRAEQEAALNASLAAKGDVEQKIADNERAAQAAERSRRAAPAAGRRPAGRDRGGEATRRGGGTPCRRSGGRNQARGATPTSRYGFRWPERSFHVTQEWGPTSFALEPPYTYRGTYYPHFHAGIDFANGCGTPIYAAGAGVVVASGQPLMPWDTGFGVVVDHGGGIQTWYWHMQPRVVVGPGTIVTSESSLATRASTGMSTGCHVHFAVNHERRLGEPAQLPAATVPDQASTGARTAGR